jgi:hypothetical protein
MEVLSSLMIIAITILCSISTEAYIQQRTVHRGSIWALCAATEVQAPVRGTFDVQRIKEAGFKDAHLASTERESYNRPERRIPKYDAPIVIIPNFLTPEECDHIVRVANDLESKGVVADLYLNHRLNKELEASESSQEARELILEQNLDPEELAADSPSGFRSQLPPSVLLGGQPLTEGQPRGHPVPAPKDSIASKILRLIGCEERKMSFLEDEWINPSKEKVMIRDQTTVHYRPGEGVPPHVDGNHATLLCYLSDSEVGAGGRTVFPEAGIASIPKRGTALIYCSKGQKLLHFAERVKKNEKYVMQVLIDHRYRKDSTAQLL